MITKKMFDSSIHIGQFSLDEDIRIRCKNAQVEIADKNSRELYKVLWVCSFWENTESDNIIWETLGRKEQDVFYPWMDVFHTVKHIEKVRESNPKILELYETLNRSLPDCSCAGRMILASAIYSKSVIIYTLYPDILEVWVVKYMHEQYAIEVMIPPLWGEVQYIWGEVQVEDGKVFDLEQLYQDAMSLYRERNIDLLQNLFALQRKENRV